MGHRRERYCKWQRNLTEPSAAGPRRVQAVIHQVAGLVCKIENQVVT
jgi:hypothetical protein